MGLLDGILNQVKNVAVQAGSQVVKEKVNDVASKEAKKAEAFAIKKFLVAYMSAIDAKYGDGQMTPEAKAYLEQHIGHIVENLQSEDFDETEMANDLNYVTNMIYRGLGKPETACSTNYKEAFQELVNVSKEMTNQQNIEQNQNTTY